MIHDLAVAESPKIFDFAIIVVGTGPAGSVVVNELLRSGTTARIGVLESGRKKPWEYADKLREVTWDGMPIKPHSRERVLGGASTTWLGLSAPLDPIDMEVRSWLDTPGWPISRSELDAYYEMASERYRFPPPKKFSLTRDTTDEAGSWRALRDSGDWRLEWRGIEEKLFLTSVPTQNFGREFQHIYDAKNVELFLDATVKKLEFRETEGSTQVSGSVVRTSRNTEFVFRAQYFVLCAGGIENARLLLNSPKADGVAVGNEHDQLGSYMMNHPKNYHGLVSLRKPVYYLPYYFGCMWSGFSGYGGLRLTDALQRKHKLVNCYVRFEPMFPWSGNLGVECLVRIVKQAKPLYTLWRKMQSKKVIELRSYSETGDDSDLDERKRSLLWMVVTILKNLPSVVHYVWYRFFKRPTIRKIRICNFMEMEPCHNNRVELSTKTDVHGYPLAHVVYDATARDVESLRYLTEVLAKELERTGIGTLTTELLNKTARHVPINLDASHHIGATRMGVDPKWSVVDPSQRVHSTTNLYISGSSVFPTSGCANPTYTIVALSIRLAEILEHKLSVTQLG